MSVHALTYMWILTLTALLKRPDQRSGPCARPGGPEKRWEQEGPHRFLLLTGQFLIY